MNAKQVIEAELWELSAQQRNEVLNDIIMEFAPQVAKAALLGAAVESCLPETLKVPGEYDSDSFATYASLGVSDTGSWYVTRWVDEDCFDEDGPIAHGKSITECMDDLKKNLVRIRERADRHRAELEE